MAKLGVESTAVQMEQTKNPLGKENFILKKQLTELTKKNDKLEHLALGSNILFSQVMDLFEVILPSDKRTVEIQDIMGAMNEQLTDMYAKFNDKEN